jgi:MFS family permease
MLVGAGAGVTFVSLTSASLADVEPEIAGAASGLVNVSQQLGAAVGLAVLVTAFNALAGHAQLAAGATSAASIHVMDQVFAVAALFTLGALLTVLFGVPKTVAIPHMAPAHAAEHPAPAELDEGDLSAGDAGRLLGASTGG